MIEKYEFENKIVSFLLNKLNPEVIYIFGSYLTEYFNEQSDIDIAVILNEEFDSKTIYNLKCELSAVIGREVDLINYNDADIVLKAEIFKKNKVIYCKDDELRYYKEMIALKEYERYNEERKIIIESKYGYEAWTLL